MQSLNLFLFCVVILTVLSEGKRTKITIYYETLCSDSVNFIKDLTNAYEYLDRHIKLDFVPFGKAAMARNFKGEYNFRCQHGEDECYGNVIHACALDQHLSDYNNLQFIKCTMVEKRIEHCAHSSGVNLYLLKNCMNSKGASLLAFYGKRTFKELKTVSFVPTIVFDNEPSHNLQREALNDIGNVICLLQNNPVECSNKKNEHVVEE